MSQTMDEYIYPENVTGSFYVNDECIACDTCTDIAKNHFKLTLDYDHAYVSKQPSSAAEITVCKDALEACPVGAIKKS